MKYQFKHYSLFLISALISICFVKCQKDTSSPANKKISITNTSASAITQIRATIRATIASDGGAAITERGICYDTVAGPTTASTKMVYDSSNTDTFALRITNLKPAKTYYARAYAINSEGTGYGEEITFTTKAIKIGDLFEGGHVFYLDATGRSGLVAAVQGLDYAAAWGCKGVSAPGTAVENGTGKANTTAILKACKTPGTAPYFADHLSDASFKDWYLPSKNELNEMYKHKDVVVMNTAERWSSSEVDANSAWALSFGANGEPIPVVRDKAALLGVRPIRAFNF